MIYAISNAKGGVGKTATALTLTAGLALKGKKTLLIDCDPQANATDAILPESNKLKEEETIYTTILNKEPLPIHKTYLENLFIVPSHILLSSADIKLTTALDHKEQRLKDQLDKIKKKFDFIILDCPPNLGWLTISALVASDSVITPVSPGRFEMVSSIQLLKTVKKVRELFNPQLKFKGFIFVMSDPTINSKESLKVLRQTYPDNVFKAIIPKNTDLRDSFFKNSNIFDYRPKSISAIAYTKLIKELFDV